MIDAKVLEDHFDTAFDAPDGIKKLRELILTLAMQGKLVPQDPKDEPASELLKKIEAEKKRLVKEGKFKEPKLLPEIKTSEVPYELPKGWVWTRLGAICSKITDGEHQTPPRIDNGCLLLSAKNVRDGFIDFDNCDQISEVDYAKARLRCLPETGDLLIVSVGGTIGRTSLVEDKTNFALVRSVAIVKPLVLDSFYLRAAFISPLIQTEIGAKKRGGAQPCLYLSEIETFSIPLPPLAEQKRIVTKIDQLMARCDALEKMREERNDKRLAAHAAAIKDLLSPSGSFAFLSSHFSEFYSVRENVTELRKAILQLAVMGKLVPQDPKDQPASELLKEIQREKARLVKEGKIKDKGTQNAEVKGPYELPKGWVWVNLLMLGSFLGGKTPSTNNSKFWNGSTPWVSAKDMKFPIITNSEDHVTQTGIDSGLSIIPANSILMVTRSGILRRTFPVAINSIPCTINQDLKALVLFHDKISRYIYLMLKGFETLILATLSKAGMTVESIMFDEFCKHPFPLPPLAEQKRIVARVDQLMSLCDELEKQIDATTHKQGELLQSLVAGV